MRCRVFSLSCVALLFFSANMARSASSTDQQSPVEKNVQRLLKTKSCPGCDLAGADLRQSRLAKANLNGANLSGANLNLADLSGANLQQAILFDANLTGADLSFANMEGAEFRNTNFVGARFERTRIKGRTVNRLIHADNAQAGWFVIDSAEGKVAENQTEASGNQSEATASQPAMTGEQEIVAALTAEASAAPIALMPPPSVGPEANTDSQVSVPPAESVAQQEAVVKEPVEAAPAELSEQQQKKIDKMFDEERCIGCDLSGLDLSDRDMGGFDLERANFSGSNLQGADLSKANLKGANFQNCRMQKADLSDADLYRADFTGADLTDADLDDAKTEDAKLSGAIGIKPAEPETAQ